MRVPLEILRIILEHLADDNDDGEVISTKGRCKLLLPLRHVNTTFDQEVLSAVFSRLDPPDADKLLYASWQVTPPSLRERYLYYRTFRRAVDNRSWAKVFHPISPRAGDNRLFTSLFNPVFERQLAKLGIQSSDHFTRHKKLTEWCKYFMHEHWRLGWIVTQCRVDYVKDLDDCYDDCQEEDQPKRRVENDRKFLEICCAIVKDDKDAVLQEFEGFCNGVDDLNYCFGTTLLGFALKWGSPEMFKLLLRSVRSTSRTHIHTYLKIAVARKLEHEDIMTNTLLDHFSGFDTRKKTFTIDLFSASVSAKDQVMFDATISWLTKAKDFPSKLCVLEWLCKHSVLRGSTRNLLTYPSPTPHTSSLSETSHLIPAYQYGLAYERYLKTVFLAEQPWIKGHTYWDTWCYNKEESKILTPPTALFLAASKGLLPWVDWLLWAGADARHLEGEPSLLDFAWKARKREQVAVLLHDHGWDLNKLMLKIG